MPEHSVNAASPPVLIGGEMAHGSDASAELGVLADLLREPIHDAHSVLLLGPTSAALAGSCSGATILVRRVADAERLAESLDRQRVRVLVGGLDRLPADERADLVIQLDPPGRMLTPDSAGSSHLEVVTMAAQHVSPGGRLVALVPGPLGLDRANSPYFPDTDADDAWWVGTSGYDERPPTLRELPRSPTHFLVSVNGVPAIAATMDSLHAASRQLAAACAGDGDAETALAAGVLADLADGWLMGLAGQPAAASGVWTVPGDEHAGRSRALPDPQDRRIRQLSVQLHRREAEVAGLRRLLDHQLRRVRALDHAMATEHGPLARRTLFLLTAPAARIVEAVRTHVVRR